MFQIKNQYKERWSVTIQLNPIDDFEIIDKILNHLNLWDLRNHDPPEIGPV